jgi:hypothetical protein
VVIACLTIPLALRERRPPRRKRARRRAQPQPRSAGVAYFPILPLVIDGPFAETKG